MTADICEFTSLLVLQRVCILDAACLVLLFCRFAHSPTHRQELVKTDLRQQHAADREKIPGSLLVLQRVCILDTVCLVLLLCSLAHLPARRQELVKSDLRLQHAAGGERVCNMWFRTSIVRLPLCAPGKPGERECCAIQFGQLAARSRGSRLPTKTNL